LLSKARGWHILDNHYRPARSARMSRRSLLVVAAAMLTLPRAAWAVPLTPPPLCRLSLRNAHTGEKFDGPYRDDNGPLPAAMADLSVFLRDFHCGAEIAYDVQVIDFLAAVMAVLGSTSATVLSAYRTPETNEMLARTTFGVAEHSQHMYGRALDVYFGDKLAEAVSAARSMKRGGVGWYPRSNFMHIDSGPVRNWELNDGGIERLLLRGGDDRSDGTRTRSVGNTDSRHPLSIGNQSGELFPEIAEQHRPLTTQQLLARLRASRG